MAPLSIQYPDYAAWQRQWFSGERQKVQVEYWRRSLADAPALLELPTDRPRPTQQSFAGAGVEVRIGEELTRGLKRLSQQQGTTLFMTLLGAWAAVLGRLSGQEEVVIGTPTANRNRREIEGLIGFFVNTLALRIDLSGEPSVGELLGRVRQTALGAQDHQDLPFEKVVELMQPERRLDVTPVFQVMFAWQNNDAGRWELPGLSVEGAGRQWDRAKFDLELDLGEADGCIAGTLLYATALFDEVTIERHRGYFLAVLRAMVADADKAVSRIELLSGEEKRGLLVEWNETARAYPADKCIHELFEEQVEKTPDAVAVVFEGESLTYRQLNAKANQLAHRLIERGVKPDARVGLCVERSLEMVAGLLGVLKAGGAYVPLEPSNPSERLVEMLRDATPTVVLSDAVGRKALGPETCEEVPVIALDEPLSDDGDSDLEDFESNPHVEGLSSSNLAYVIYTPARLANQRG